MAEAEGVKSLSYRNVVANKSSTASCKRLSFELQPPILEQFFQEYIQRDKAMEVKVKTSYPKVTHVVD